MINLDASEAFSYLLRLTEDGASLIALFSGTVNNMLVAENSLSVIYKITFPNGKIYVGHDRTNTLRYFGSWNCALVASDFTEADLKDFTLRKEILWESATATWSEVQTREYEFIRDLRANDPEIGYNRSPKLKRLTATSTVSLVGDAVERLD